ncbi:MAG: pyridoxine 5'-phosphate synthase, partial [Candidatus Omnitrophica bacterium]|nr:pyridoxine 5'-phosphate synthase [Candidatus Omnitrophota bacterium]
MPKLGVNIDHVATVRQARRGVEPDPVEAAVMCLRSGANSIVAHLREDRRHIQDADVYALRKAVRNNFNLEMSVHPSVVKVALAVRPDQVTLVPERRRELTTEGGLDVAANYKKIAVVVEQFQALGIIVSLFVAADKKQIDACVNLSVNAIEIHTGAYADAQTSSIRSKELNKIVGAAKYAHDQGLIVNVGHGLNYQNTAAIARIAKIEELNIGHSIIAHAI